jgi:hypothetical protein
MSIGSFIKKIGKFLFSSSTKAGVETFVISEVQQVIAILAPAVVTPLTDTIKVLEDKTMPGVEKLEALAVDAIRIVAAVKGLTISKDIALALAQKVYTDAKAAVQAEALAALARL